MTEWARLVAAALLGTQRRPVPALPAALLPDGALADGALADGAAGDQSADGDDPAGRLLAQAALLTVRRRAGRRPESADPVAPAPAETAPAVPPAAARRLERILGGEQARLLAEWLAAAVAAGHRVPAALLPDLLDRGRVDRALRPHLARAAGHRGMWLALRNPEWAYLVAEPAGPPDGSLDGAPATDPDVWESGTRGARLAHLERLRAADPGAARDALRGTWASEPAADRAAFLATFDRGLDQADEEFLEAALADRAKDVRQVAAGLLARLPGSAYGRRTAELAAARLRAERRPDASGERRWIVVEPPPDGGAAALRDLIAHAPLGTWTELFALPPAQIVRLPVADDHGPDLQVGWARAAAATRDAAWARALLGRALLDGGLPAGRLDLAADLLGALPGAEREAAAAELLRRAGGYRDRVRILEAVPGRWAGALADAVLGLLADAAGRADTARYAGAVGQVARLAEERLSPGVAPRLVEITRRHDTWPLTDLAETLRFRRDMLEELGSARELEG
ncbi:MAG TPA: DUF5691 domain-containing protein [Streptosporangiaceae bacterium]